MLFKTANKLVALDDGHGMETRGKRSPLLEDGTFMLENEFNRSVVDKLIVYLQINGFDILHVSSGDTDIPLKTRTDLANNTVRNTFNRRSDIFVSVHANATTGAWNETGRGIETFYKVGSSEGKLLAECVQRNLLQGQPLANRGIKTNNLHITRETKMPAVLVECGFMDNKEEIELLMSDDYRTECALEIAKGICEYFGTEFITEPIPEVPKKAKYIPLILGERTFDGFILDGKSWIPAKEVMTALNFIYWSFKVKSIYVNDTQLETVLFKGTAYIKATDLKINDILLNVMFDPDSTNVKRVLLFPKEVSQ